MSEREWQPGDPLYRQTENGGAGYRQHLFNFRDDSRSEECVCTDSATWPEPKTHHRLHPNDDELADFIAHWHRWRRIEESA